MAINFIPNKIKFKNNQGNYENLTLVSDEAIETMKQEIENKKEAALNQIPNQESCNALENVNKLIHDVRWYPTWVKGGYESNYTLQTNNSNYPTIYALIRIADCHRVLYIKVMDTVEASENVKIKIILYKTATGASNIGQGQYVYATDWIQTEVNIEKLLQEHPTATHYVVLCANRQDETVDISTDMGNLVYMYSSTSDSEILNNLAVQFDETQAYDMGQYVMYTDGKLYRLASDHIANQTWANTNKIQVTLGAELSTQQQNEQIDTNNLLSNFAGLFDTATSYTAGQYVTYSDAKLYRLTNDHTAGIAWADTSKTQIAIGTEIDTLNKGHISSRSIDAITIDATEESPADLNDYIIPGTYKVMTADVASHILNSPTNVTSYRLIVLQTTYSERIFQIAFMNATVTDKVSIRNYTNAGWTDWQIFADQEYVDDASLIYFNAADLNSFSIADMPRRSYTYTYPYKFIDCPQEISNSSTAIRVVREKYNSTGNVSLVTVQIKEGNSIIEYITQYSETSWSGWWVKRPTQNNIIEVEDTIEKVSETQSRAVKRTYNLFNQYNPSIINAYIASNKTTFTSSSSTKTLYIPCSPNTVYMISRAAGNWYINNVGCSADIPVVGGEVTFLQPTSNSNTVIDGRFYRKITTTNDAQYLAIYFYNSTRDDPNLLQTFLNEMMIYEGDKYLPYHGYTEPFVTYNDKLPINTYGIFGIRFERNAANPAVRRIYDAEGLEYRQQTGEAIEYSDFDKAFPWCEMRECNVTIDNNGDKTIVYRGESGFSRHSNTFIEVPAFYFKRTVVHGIEEWAISGRPFSGADIEPWFVNEDGSIAKYRYFAKYEGADPESGKVSVTGVMPKTDSSLAAFKTHCESINCKLMTIYAHLAISHLIAIEYATLNVQSINSGISYMPYSISTSTWNIAQSTVNGNTITLPYEERLARLNVGDTIFLSDTSAQDLTDQREVTAITVGSSLIEITFSDGAYEIKEGVTRCYPAMQPTGRTDTMTYYNGRSISNEKNSPFQYRGIENPYGNVWEYADGGTWSLSTGKFTLGNIETSFTAPTQTVTGSDANCEGWIKTLGYDRKIPWATLPETVGGSPTTYIPEEWTTSGTAGTQIFNVSGGWDHQTENGIFNMRTFSVSYGNWLYGYRAIID